MATLLDPEQRGRVILVGAGPGDPELLTLKAVAALQSADVVVHDGLVDARVFDHVPAQAQRISVAKKRDRHTLSQDAINALIIAHAKTGATVVRLKGGDPFVFGRGGEECDALRDAGIEVDVVGGLTAGIAGPASIGIPVTDRRYTRGVALVTGHSGNHSENSDSEPDWAALVQSRLTLVIYMGVSRLPTIVQALIAGGLDSDTPAAAVSS